MNSDTPKNLEELFQFYYNFVKPLYSDVQTQNALPQETLFELNAAFDHISRHWYYGEPEKLAVEKAYGHLKRSCLDIFKLELKKAIDQFNELNKIDTSVIDQGQFDAKLVQLISEIKSLGKEARMQEGEYRKTNEQQHAFKLWQPVWDKCKELENNFYNSKKVDWAKNRQSNISWKMFWISVISSFVSGAILAVITLLVGF